MNATCNQKCGLFEFMANDVGIKVLHPGGYNATKHLCSYCNINKNSNILDLACGVGTSSIYLHEEFNCNVTGIDIDEDLISIAKAAKSKITDDRKLTFKVANALALPFPDNTFNTVVSQAVFILIDDNQKVLEEIARVLKPGGRLGALELSWFTTPTEEAYTELRSRTCDVFIPRVRTFDDWDSFFKSSQLTHVETSKHAMQSGMLKMIKTEGLINFSKIIIKMMGNASIRRRMMSVQEAFKKYKEYLGYGIYCYEKSK